MKPHIIHIPERKSLAHITNRDRILDMLKRKPGLTFDDLMREMHIGHSGAMLGAFSLLVRDELVRFEPSVSAHGHLVKRWFLASTSVSKKK